MNLKNMLVIYKVMRPSAVNNWKMENWPVCLQDVEDGVSLASATIVLTAKDNRPTFWSELSPATLEVTRLQLHYSHHAHADASKPLFTSATQQRVLFSTILAAQQQWNIEACKHKNGSAKTPMQP